MARHHFLFALSGGLGIALACGSSGSGDWSRKSYSGGASPADPDHYGALDGGFVVPPDRALQSVGITVTAATAEAAAAELRARAAALEAAASTEACQARLVDYGVPSAYGREAWQGTAEVRVDVVLKGLDGLQARMDAVDACQAALAPLLTGSDGVELDGGEGQAWVDRSRQLAIVVDDRHRFAGELLSRRAQRLAAVADASAAPQLHPEDQRCTATGEVSYGSRSLDGVELILGMSCRVLDPVIEVEQEAEAPPS